MTIKMIILYVMALLYILAGLNHFRAPKVYRPLMPPWIPLHDLMIYLSGVFEVLFGAMLFYEPTRSLAAWGIILMLAAFMAVHIYMYQARDTVFKNVPKAIIIIRIPLQFVLIYWAYIYTA